MNHIVTLIEELKQKTKSPKDDTLDVKLNLNECKKPEEPSEIVEEKKALNSDDELENALNELLEEKYGGSKLSHHTGDSK